MKRLINIFILIFSISFVIIIVSGNFKLDCIIKDMFNICCPGCGLTRSFRAILNFNFIEAIYYNILGIPLFICGIILFISFIIDIIKNNNKTIIMINNILNKYYAAIVILVIITFIINNINGI